MIKSFWFRNRTVLWCVQQCTLATIQLGLINSSSSSMWKFTTSHDVNHILNSVIISSCKLCPQSWGRIFVLIIYDTLLNHVVFCPTPSMVLWPFPKSKTGNASFWDSGQSSPCLVPILNKINTQFSHVNKKWGISPSVVMDRVYQRQLTLLFKK